MKIAYSFLIYVLVSSAYANEITSDFIPEASGACRLGDSLVIAGDEEPESLWLASESGKTAKTKVSNAAWDDMEGLACIDQANFFATTSHSRTKKGKRKPEREQLMLMTMSGKKINARYSWSLRVSVLALLEKSLSQELDMKIVEGASPDDGGLNIEGLAYREGKLYLGLRSPVTNSGKAILLVIKNASELFKGAAPVFGEVLTIALSGKGIRGLDIAKDGLLVLGGSTNDTSEKFSLTEFNPTSRSLEAFMLNGFDDLIRPEGVVVEENGDVTFVQDFEGPQTQETIVRLSP